MWPDFARVCRVIRQRRVRFEYGDGIMPLVSAVKRLGVVEVQNPTHLSLDVARYAPDEPNTTIQSNWEHAGLWRKTPSTFSNIQINLLAI